MRPNPEEEGKWWIKQAESDFASLPGIMKTSKYDIVCFISQQVAEKALKAYLIYKGEELIVSHSISRLCDICAKYDIEFKNLRKKIKRLTPYYVEARYPNALEEIPAEYFDRGDAEEASQMAGEALKFVKKKLSF